MISSAFQMSIEQAKNPRIEFASDDPHPVAGVPWTASSDATYAANGCCDATTAGRRESHHFRAAATTGRCTVAAGLEIASVLFGRSGGEVLGRVRQAKSVRTTDSKDSTNRLSCRYERIRMLRPDQTDLG